MMELEGGGKLFFFIQISFSYISMKKMKKNGKNGKNEKKMEKKWKNPHRILRFEELRGEQTQ